MSLPLSLRRCALSMITAAALSLAVVPSVYANGPVITVVGENTGELQLNNPVRFQGTAVDPDGIGLFFPAIQNASTGRYINQQGGNSNKAEKLKFKFTGDQWVSQSFNLPRGNYVFSIRAQDKRKNISRYVKVPFVATGVKGPALAAAPANNQRQPANSGTSAVPRIAVQFPKDGARLDKASAFSGVAADDQAVAGVIATIMDTATGQFLAPNGKFARSGQFKIRTVGGKSAQWSTPQVQLPPGDYMLSVKAVDNNNQESSWAQSRFTIVQPQRTATAAAPQVNNQTNNQVVASSAAANGLAYCGNGSADADGDGYGWQNQASCVVKGSKADTHPNCASAASDPDGDGYGWENEKSCIVVVHCASSNSDPDGDGFGWENQRSCVVLNTTGGGQFPRCANGAASDPDGDGYGWENNATCLVN